MLFRNLDRSFYRFVTIHACDRQTDGQTDSILIAIRRLRIPCSAVKKPEAFRRNSPGSVRSAASVPLLLVVLPVDNRPSFMALRAADRLTSQTTVHVLGDEARPDQAYLNDHATGFLQCFKF